MELSVDVQPQGGHTLVDLAGEIDIHTAPELHRRLSALLEDGHERLLVDMGSVAFLDSTGISVLVTAFKETRQRGGWLRLVDLGEPVLKVLRLTGLVQVLEIYPTRAEAVERP